jgi:hypothetical protein
MNVTKFKLNEMSYIATITNTQISQNPNFIQKTICKMYSMIINMKIINIHIYNIV